MTREEAIAHGKEQLEVFGGEHREFIEMAIKALENEPKWIPVSERLPEYGREVLTCNDGGYIEIQSCESTYTYWENQFGDWSAIDEDLWDEVVAWMPLPEPYKGAEE